MKRCPHGWDLRTDVCPVCSDPNNGKLEHIGYFESKDDAILARKQKEKEYEFHNNHGRV